MSDMPTCEMCEAKVPVVYYGDGSGYQGWLHRVSESELTECPVQVIQRGNPPKYGLAFFGDGLSGT